MSVIIKDNDANSGRNPRIFSYNCRFVTAEDLEAALVKVEAKFYFNVETKGPLGFTVNISVDKLPDFGADFPNLYKPGKTRARYRGIVAVGLEELIVGKKKVVARGSKNRAVVAKEKIVEKLEFDIDLRIKSKNERQLNAVKDYLGKVFALPVTICQHTDLQDVEKRKDFIAKFVGRLSDELIQKAQLKKTDNSEDRKKKLRNMVSDLLRDAQITAGDCRITVSTTEVEKPKEVPAARRIEPIVFKPASVSKRIKTIPPADKTAVTAQALRERIAAGRKDFLKAIGDTVGQLPNQDVCCLRLMVSPLREENWVVCMGGNATKLESFKEILLHDLGGLKVKNGVARGLHYSVFKVSDELAGDIKLALEAVKTEAFKKQLDKEKSQEKRKPKTAGRYELGNFVKDVIQNFHNPYETITLKLTKVDGYYLLRIPALYTEDPLKNRIVTEAFGFTQRVR